MRFVQVMEMQTSNFDELERLHEQWRKDSEGQRTVAAEMICRDRDNPDRYMIIVEFPSYEDAMKNNDLPATKEIAAGMEKLLNAPPVFHNLDLVRRD